MVSLQTQQVPVSYIANKDFREETQKEDVQKTFKVFKKIFREDVQKTQRTMEQTKDIF